MEYGPFDNDEISFYKRRLADGTSQVKINSFQKDLIFNLFYKYFGDTQPVNVINLDDYICLILSAKRILEENGMYLLAAIVSSKVVRLATRKNVNKKEMTKLETSELYKNIQDKYQSEKIEKHILSIIAAMLSSDFEYIDYEEPELDGSKIIVTSEVACEEILMYISLI